jgi:anti-sigma factor RsiW
LIDVRRGHLRSVASSAIRCSEFIELVTDWMEGALPEPVRTEIEEHLLLCDRCVEHVARINAAVAALQAIDAGPPPAPRRDELLAAFRANRCDGSDRPRVRPSAS